MAEGRGAGAEAFILMKKIASKLPEDIYQKFTALVKREGVTISEVIREMVESFCDDTGVK